MSEVIAKWILHRLGVVIDMSPDKFAVKTSNGFLLAQILQSYEVITVDELNLIKDSDQTPDCYRNFSLITNWLQSINLTLNTEDMYEIVHGIGSSSLNLFYQVFLELKDKTKLDFLTDNELDTQLGKRISRFYVTKVDETGDPNRFDLHRDNLCEPFLESGDVYHWYKDRMENLQRRCKEARDEYIHNVQNRCKDYNTDTPLKEKESRFDFARGITAKLSEYTLPTTPQDQNEDIDSIDNRTYEDLVKEQEDARKLPQFKEDPKEAKKLIKQLRNKSKTHEEHKIFMNQLHQEIINKVDKKIDESKKQLADERLIKVFMKQSLFEKELVSKVAQVAMFKEYMLDSRFKQEEILNKLREKHLMDALFLKDKELNEKKLSYYFEHERIIQLHKKIWAERLRLQEKRHRDICSNAVKDMVDMSMRIAEFKRQYGRDPNPREIRDLKSLFLTSQPIYEVCKPVVNILKECDDVVPEEIITRELSRQNAMDDEQFNGYMCYEWPWELKNIDISQDIYEQICYGLNVLGYIVHRALRTKYPIVSSREVPNFPEATVRVCLNGFNDIVLLPTLRELLCEREIHVIELNQAVEFCINVFKEESKREYDDEDTTSNNKQAKPTKEDKPPKKKKGEKPKKGKKPALENSESVNDITKQMQHELVQTPIKFPDEDIQYSPAAILGKTAQELLDDGQPLGDFLLIDIFIAYLQSLPNLKGWVLVNYPTTFDQAVILEQALTGKHLLGSGIKLNVEKSLSDITEQEPADDKEDSNSLFGAEEKVLSRLLPDPVGSEPPKDYDTILTAFIRIKKLPHDDKTGEGMLPPGFEELGEEPDPLDRFYSNAGANYSMYYKEFDYPTIKYLGKLIIGDYSLPLKSSVELFGEVAERDHQQPRASKSVKKGEQLKKPKKRMIFSDTDEVAKTITKDDPDAKGKKGKKAKVVIVFENKGVQVPSEDEEEVEEVDLSTSVTELSPRPGETGWEYSTEECPEELLIALATLWEAVEEIYINDLKQSFFLKRLNLDTIMPFAQYVKETMTKIINRLDYKGFYLSKFQKAFNGFEMDIRKDDEFKAEMHCRIEDFKEKLTEMCDVKMMESEEFRCNIIDANWTPGQLKELLNSYINMIQIELDRFIESIRFMNDYYLGITTGMPSDDDQCKEEALPKYHTIRTEIINQMLKDKSSTVDVSYFDELLSSVIQKTQSIIKKLNIVTTTLMEKKNSNQKGKSKPASPKSKTSKSTKAPTIGVDILVPEESYNKLLNEWQCALSGETQRVNLRIDLLKRNALESMEEFIRTIQQAFHAVYDELNARYRKELENVEVAGNVFKSAVENEVPLQKELLFDEYHFLINPEVNMFDNPPIIPKLPKEIAEKGAFTVTQLSKLASILMDLSPSGYMPRATFTYVLQDIVCVTPGDGSDWLSPILWRQLNYKDINKVIDSLFDDLEYVYWKDFIICNLRVSYPTEKELLLTRTALRACDPDATELVQDYQFYSTKLWFEYSFQTTETNKIQAIKKLLYRLYHIKGYGLNYTALLLDFCKGATPIEGFAKALELSIGKLVCWDQKIGQMFTEECFRRISEHENNVKQRDAERSERYQTIYDEVSKFVDQITEMCDQSVVIEELDPPHILSDKSLNISNILKQPEEEKEKEDELTQDSQEICTQEASSELQSREDTETSEILKVYNELPDNVDSDCDVFGSKLFFITLDPVITVIGAALPWHLKIKKPGDLSYWDQAAEVFESCRNPDFNKAVLCHEFLNSKRFSNLLDLTKKFSFIDPVSVVNEILNGKGEAVSLADNKND